MEPYERESELQDDAYPYQDYYSTGGRYRPPKQPRNHGWLVAVMGLLLLCVTGGAVLSRDYRGDTEEASASPQTTAVQTTAENIAETQSTTSETPRSGDENQEDYLGSGTVLTISPESDEKLELTEIYKKVIPSVVSISAFSSDGTSTGTGIIMSSDGYIITNYHVVTTAQQITVLLNSGEEYSAASVGGDEASDLMVLKIDEDGLTPAEFGDSDSVEVGDSVVAIGDPLGVELRGTMTDGIICGINRDVSIEDRTMTLMQTNAALNSGNSGGPLVNMAGQVIGINTAKLSSSYSTVEGLGFAIPITSAKPIVDELVEKGYVSGRPSFGFTIESLDSRIALFYDLPGSLCVSSVDTDSDAYAQGIRSGDIITAVAGENVSSKEEFDEIKNEYSAGDQVTLTIFRNGEIFDVEVTLSDRADLD